MRIPSGKEIFRCRFPQKPLIFSLKSRLVLAPRVNKTISNIPRDTRFSHDKSLCRETCGAVSSSSGPRRGVALLYFEISGSGFGYSCGYHSVSPRYLDVMRRLILRGDESFSQVQAAMEVLPQYQLEGEHYKRPHYPDQPVSSAGGWSSAASACRRKAGIFRCCSSKTWRRGSFRNEFLWPDVPISPPDGSSGTFR